MKKFLRSYVSIVGLLFFATAPFVACTTLTNIKNAVTGSNAVLTCKVLGAVVDTVMTDAAKLRVAGVITQAQWATIAADHDKFQQVYNTEVAAIAARNAPASGTLTALYNQVLADYGTFK